ncbi:MAG TPA: hypothetical protein VGF16_16765 [Bryobacteraceae bacterium]
MTEYPSGVLQNVAAPGKPADLQPVNQANWKWFSTQADADTTLGWVKALSPGAQMGDATKGQYSQYVYFDQTDPDVCVRVICGMEDGLFFVEYAGELFDAHENPRPFIDDYPDGETPTQLKIMQITPQLGQLYWAA